MPKEIPWNSEITEVSKNKLVTRGIDQTEMIRNFSFEEMLFLLVKEQRPTTIQADLLRAVIVSHCSHGLTGQSTLAVRMAADCRSPFLNAALGGFLVGSGDFHQGALQRSMELLLEAHQSENIDIFLEKRIKSGAPIYGYGHRFHSRDPRAEALMELCQHHDFKGEYIQIAQSIQKIIGLKFGKYMNIEAACGSILLDLGFPPDIASLVIILGRVPMYAATYLERLQSNSKPFQRIAVYDIIPGKEKL